MFVETKETSLEQLIDCIMTMNKKTYWQNPIKGTAPAVKDENGNIIKSAVTKEMANEDFRNRKGYEIQCAILRNYKVTTLYELNKHQINSIILFLHKSVIS